jgi:hypothetical protein
MISIIKKIQASITGDAKLT